MTNTYKNTAWLYDFDERDNLTVDIPFYLEYAQKTGGEVLELGCGTGRVALALAEHDISVTGLDLSDTMLEVFHKKLNSNPDLKQKITLVKGNMADFHWEKKFSLIIAPFRAFQALTDDRDIAGFLRCIHEHLAPGGLFIVNVFRPHNVLDESWCYPETVQWERTDESNGIHVVKKHWGDKIDTINQIMYPHYAYYVTDKSGKTKRITDDSALKYYYEDQLAERLQATGFKILERFGWYDKTSIEDAKRELIFVCRRNMT